MDADGIEKALREAGISVAEITPTPGFVKGDVVVFLVRMLQEQAEAKRVLEDLPGVAEVKINQNPESILYVRLWPGLRVVR
jgi:uncharacterized protein YaaQ